MNGCTCRWVTCHPSYICGANDCRCGTPFINRIHNIPWKLFQSNVMPGFPLFAITLGGEGSCTGCCRWVTHHPSYIWDAYDCSCGTWLANDIHACSFLQQTLLLLTRTGQDVLVFLLPCSCLASFSLVLYPVHFRRTCASIPQLEPALLGNVCW